MGNEEKKPKNQKAKFNLKEKMTPKFLKEWVEKREAEVAAYDVASIPSPTRRISGARKMKDFSDGNKWVHLAIMCASIVGVFLLWWVLSANIPKVASFLSTPSAVWDAFVARVNIGWYFDDLKDSLVRVLVGFCLAVVASIPTAFLMSWYRPVRGIFDPWIQFLRTIPPIAINPIMVAAFGVGENPKYAIIFLAVYLTMTVTIYQGIRNVDLTLVKAAYTFGAKDRNLFLGVIIPSAFPFILTAMRLGVGAALTTLIAAEMTGANTGLGAMIQSASGANRIDIVMMGIITIGIVGFILDRLLLLLEKVCTRWK